jgi:predicted TIM-barrel enzyme
MHPLIVGAGLTHLNVAEQLTIADGAIVGSCFKTANLTTQKIQSNLVKQFMDEVIKLRK